MKERFGPQPPDQARQAQAERELTRLEELEGFVVAKARQFARNDYMLAEDLAQEAREAIVRRLRENPDCPTSHLKVKATDAVYRYRARGSSVDGKLYPVNRKKNYQVTSLEAQIDRHDSGNGPMKAEIIGEAAAVRRFTEERACTNLLFDYLRDSLTETENQILSLRLMGDSWEKVRKILGLTAWEVVRLRREMDVAVQLALGLAELEEGNA